MWPRPLEQDPVSPTVSLAHQEASISLLSLSIRGQTEEASGGDGIPVELFQILKDDGVKVLHSIC